jgi:predicted Fe-Mo cluster-binding NifX family protein
MKIALPVCDNRVSTVFDAADELLLVETGPGGALEQTRVRWKEDAQIARMAQIRESGVRVLICGAMSGSMERMLNAAGIRVIPFIRGTTDEILDAFCNGTLSGGHFFLPGCAPCQGQGNRRRQHLRAGCKWRGRNKS